MTDSYWIKYQMTYESAETFVMIIGSVRLIDSLLPVFTAAAITTMVRNATTTKYTTETIKRNVSI